MKSTPESEAELAHKLLATKSKKEAEEAALAVAERETKTAETLLQDDKKLLLQQQREHKEWLRERSTEVKQLEDKIKELKRAKKEAADATKESVAYQKSQEAAVDEFVETSNVRLRELQADIATTDRLKDDALRELASVQEQTEDGAKKNADLATKLDALTALYLDTAARYKIELNDLQAQIKIATADLAKNRRDAQSLVKRLAEKEQELAQREEILDDRETKQAEEAEFLRKKRARIST